MFFRDSAADIDSFLFSKIGIALTPWTELFFKKIIFSIIYFQLKLVLFSTLIALADRTSTCVNMLFFQKIYKWHFQSERKFHSFVSSFIESDISLRIFRTWRNSVNANIFLPYDDSTVFQVLSTSRFHSILWVSKWRQLALFFTLAEDKLPGFAKN